MTSRISEPLVQFGRTWCPTEWIDEVCALTVTDPTEALRDFGADGGWRLVQDDFLTGEKLGMAERVAEQEIPLEPGRVMSWEYREERGDFTLTVDGNGVWSLDGEIPERVTQWWTPFDPDTISDDLPTLATNLEPGEYLVSAYYWSDGMTLRFEIEDGKGRFVQVAGAN